MGATAGVSDTPRRAPRILFVFGRAETNWFFYFFYARVVEARSAKYSAEPRRAYINNASLYL